MSAVAKVAVWGGTLPPFNGTIAFRRAPSAVRLESPIVGVSLCNHDAVDDIGVSETPGESVPSW